MKSIAKQRASILIIVMWIISISLVLVSVLASNSRLSATIVMHQQEALNNWSKMLAIINQAKMLVLLNPTGNSLKDRLQLSKAKIDSVNKEYLFNGNKIKLEHPASKDMIIRIYDLSGKLNLKKINHAKFKQILLKKLGKDNKKVDELLDAWLDWKDADSLKRLNGAEKNYYSKQEPAYLPRNAALQSVNELNLIKGFQEVFGNYDYSQVFTLYGVNSTQINPNIANKETLLIIPGIDENLADEIIKKRNEMFFSNMAEFNALIPTAVASKVKSWFRLSKSRFYAIVIYSKKTEQDAKKDSDGNNELYAYKEIIQIWGQNNRIRTLRVFPSYKIRI